jgi:hypothetical protein
LIVKTLDALGVKPSSPIADALGRHVHPPGDLYVRGSVGRQQHQLRANDNAVGERQTARATLKLDTLIGIKLDRCCRSPHAITFVNQTAVPSSRQNLRRGPLSAGLQFANSPR